MINYFKMYQSYIYHNVMLEYQDSKKILRIKHWFTWYCTHTELHQQFLKITFVVAGGEFYSNYIHQGNKSDKQRKIVRIVSA